MPLLIPTADPSASAEAIARLLRIQSTTPWERTPAVKPVCRKRVADATRFSGLPRPDHSRPVHAPRGAVSSAFAGVRHESSPTFASVASRRRSKGGGRRPLANLRAAIIGVRADARAATAPGSSSAASQSQYQPRISRRAPLRWPWGRSGRVRTTGHDRTANSTEVVRY